MREGNVEGGNESDAVVEIEIEIDVVIKICIY